MSARRSSAFGSLSTIVLATQNRTTAFTIVAVDSSGNESPPHRRDREHVALVSLRRRQASEAIASTSTGMPNGSSPAPIAERA
jgi:hypothetical protein